MQTGYVAWIFVVQVIYIDLYYKDVSKADGEILMPLIFSLY